MPNHRGTIIAAVAALVATIAVVGSAPAADVILNEYNAVDSSGFLGGAGSDVFWQQRAGNGDDWFELVVITDALDMRGWEIVVVNDAGEPTQESWSLTLSNHDVWFNLRSGTIITFSELLSNNADDYEPLVGSWWLNVKAAAGGSGTYVSVSCIAPACLPADANWKVSNNNSQITIKDDLGSVVFGPAGEGIQPTAGIGSTEIFKLEEDPTAAITPTSGYNDGTSSTFGAPNVFSAGTQQQNFSTLRSVVSYEPLTTVRINELLSHSDPAVDWVELYNASSDPIDIGGWYLSDSFANLTKNQIPMPTIVAAGDFVVFDATQLGFALSAPCGDELILSVGDGLAPTGPRDFVRFGPVENGATLGRAPDGHGHLRLARLATPSKGAANGGESVGPVVINEIMYNPLPPLGGVTIDPEFVELHNTSAAAVALFTDYGPDGIQPWKLSGGVDFEFPTGTTIAADGYLVVVNFDPGAAATDLADFRTIYGIDASVQIVGPYGGKLSNFGDAVRLRKPDTPDADGDVCGGIGNPSPYVPYVLIDEVSYFDFGDWPDAADGLGASLERIDGTANGSDAGNWAANKDNAGTPGGMNSTESPPNKDQQKCVNTMAKDFARVVKTQGKENANCIELGSKGDLADGVTIDTCLTLDGLARVAKAKTKTSTDFTKRCTGLGKGGVPKLPPFGPSDPEIISTAAVDEEGGLMHHGFGAVLDASILDAATDATGAKCQQLILKRLQKCEGTLLKDFAACLKSGLASASIDNARSLAQCLGSDVRGKVAAACDATSGRVRAEVAKSCSGKGVALDLAFPGCATTDEALTATCLDTAVRCRACQSVNAAFEAVGDCDALDNGSADASCPGP
ncbi:MAG: lamin tail domain-containing protein [Myxococcales bacterium]|nr:MAG: lamin tail domain-containing protein [Myxococcales bacterium]